MVLLAGLVMAAYLLLSPIANLAQTAYADTTRVITLTSPKDGQQVRGAVTLNATAADSASSMVFYVDGNRYQSSTTGSVSWDASTALPGEHTISVMAYSDSGSIIGSDQVNVTVKQPITISSPATGSTVSGLVDIKAATTAAFARANFYVDDNFVATGPPLDYEWNANNADPGEHEITVKAYSADDDLLGQDTIYLNVPPPSEAAIKSKLMPVVMTDTNPATNGGFIFPLASDSLTSGHASLMFPLFDPSTPLKRGMHRAVTETADPGYVGAFAMTGGTLPSDAQCAARIGYSSWEPRPQNYTANHTVPTASQLSYVHSVPLTNGEPWSYLARVDGHFTGTTAEIIQWASCKWGFNKDVTAAIAVGESHWLSSGAGDWTTNGSLCPSGGVWKNGSCARSYGIMQIKWPYNKGSFPLSRTSTAFNLDYKLAYQRACFDGKIGYLHQRSAAYGGGSADYKLWGCVGQWYSGNWLDPGAIDYINKIKALYFGRTWFNSYF